MIVTDYTTFIEQLKVIDAQSYIWSWYDQGWLTAKEYRWRILATDGLALGYSCFRVFDKNTLFLAKLAIRPIYRSQSLGSRLMNDLILIANGTRIVTFLHEENKFLGWAKAWNWRCTALKREFFPDGRDALVMELLTKKKEEDNGII